VPTRDSHENAASADAQSGTSPRRRTMASEGGTKSKREILVLADYYLPGFKAGGPIRCLANIVAGLGDEFAFKVVTRDRDYGDGAPYPGIVPNAWHSLGKARVLHLSPGNLNARTLRRVISESNSPVVYLNSFFSPFFTLRTLLLRWARALPP